MLLIKKLVPLRKKIKEWKQKNKSIAFIPTMGNLHEGHMTLINTGSSVADKTVVSIFINPTQFDQLEDLNNYPRTFKEDYQKLTECNVVDLIFYPTVSTIYPKGKTNHTIVDIPILSNILDGKNRPNHFRGVITIISKLFNLIQPDFACFGEKDFQQLFLIRRLVHDMNYDIKIISVPIVRSSDGLALSSRNNYLNYKERLIAPKLNQVLMWFVSKFSFDNKKNDELLIISYNKLSKYGFRPDNLIVCDAENLQTLSNSTKKVIVMFSAWLGKTRLIDNFQIDYI